MSSAVAEFDNTLSSMLALKNGVSGAKIQAITSLCNANVKDEPVLIQKLYAQFKKVETSKKLAVLYVIDSVTRQWVEQAKKAGQTIGHGARDGTYAAGVMHVSELLPALMQDIISVIPDEQREKLHKLIAIWEKAGTFPPALLHGFREKLNAPPAQQTTTPSTTPPPQPLLAPQPSANPAQSTSSILASLQALAAASKNAVPQAVPQLAAPNTYANNAPQFQSAPVVPAMPVPSAMQAVNPGGVMYGNGFPPSVPNTFPVGAQISPPAQIPALPQDNTVLQQQIMILQTLQSQGIPQAEWPRILAAITSSTSVAAPPPLSIPLPPQSFPPVQHGQQVQNGRGYEGMRSPNGNNYGDRRSRSRSRSPRGYRDNDHGRRRSPDRNDRGGRKRGGKGQRNHSPSPNRYNDRALPPPGPKWIDFDRTMPKGHIKVFSRTLFVGGVTCNDSELRSLFSRSGIVQTCITSAQKRHAFVKMLTRKDAEKARETFEHYNAGDMQLRTRWGVGFGPRDASDYQSGISIIAIDRLTEADRKWVLTAEYGGTGGRELESQMCMEEPDIEIGGGVSSKAISRRMQTDRSGAAGPRSSKSEDQQPPQQPQQSRRRPDNQGSHYNEQNVSNVQVAPTVPSFGYQLPPNFSMPQGVSLPPGFTLPGGQQSSSGGGS